MIEEKLIGEKVLNIEKSTRNYDKMIYKGVMLSFPEKHYLTPGSIPDDAVKVVCRYFALFKE